MIGLRRLRAAVVDCPPPRAWGCSLAVAGVVLAALGVLAGREAAETPGPVIVRTGTPSQPFVTVHPPGSAR